MFLYFTCQIKSISYLIVFFLMMTFSFAVFAETSIKTSFDQPSIDTKAQNIPDNLKQWIPWVTKDKPEIKCPIIYNKNRHLCAYPGTLLLSIGKTSGTFLQAWTLYTKSFVPVPGDYKNWPENIQVNEQLYPVVNHNGHPFIQLPKGSYQIQGHFNWKQQPKNLAIPKETGLIKLILNDKPVNTPDFRKGKLWLKTSTITSHQNNSINVHVFRKVTDSIPLKMDTMIKLDISGQQREVTLNGVLLNNFKVSEIKSRLPVQIDTQGFLKIQVRPGQWTINVASFFPGEINSISLSSIESASQNKKRLNNFWPKTEIWVLDQQPHLRRITVTGKVGIDANQTQLPDYWKKYPAFQMKVGEKMTFNVIKRGDPEPEPDQLNLNKKIWLDFDGKGLTVNDQITGKLSRQWRLNVSNEINLGQVTLNGAPQFITQDKDQLKGVEVRHGQLSLSADSRIESQKRTLSSSGWNIDFNRVNANLYLPAGWKLFSLSGADASGTWLKQWTLLDLFLVLITSIAVFKLWGIQWGVVALLTLTLTWHQSNAPQFIWINLIIAVALLRVLPTDGRIYQLIRNYRFAVLFFLVLMILPFIVDQARTALYPQLEHQNAAMQNYGGINEHDEISFSTDPAPQVKKSLPGKVQSTSSYLSQSYSTRRKSKSVAIETPVEMQKIDPNAMIQTGPGLPSWTLNNYAVHWDGPVRSTQQISMVLISPVMNSILNVLRILLVLLLAIRLMDVPFLFVKEGAGKISKQTFSHISAFFIPSFLFVALSFSLTFVPQTSMAAFPTKELLNELQMEINKPAECLPQCADIESINIELTTQTLNFKLRVHALEAVSIPLPVPIKQWMPNQIVVDGDVASASFRNNDPSQLWLFLTKGSHLIEIGGQVEYINQLQISFPLKPHHIRLAIEGWSSEGMDEDITKISGLSFLKQPNQQEKDQTQKSSTNILPSEIPVFAEMTRIFNLGLSWKISTTVRGLWGSSYPVILKIPLMADEIVLSDNVKVENGQAIITLKHKNSTVRWLSKLAIANEIKLKAIDSKKMIEKWVLNTSPIWHIQYSGIPVVYHQNQSGSSKNDWQPSWQPWPGEEVLIKVTRPAGVKGKTVTIDSSVLTIEPGEQNTSARLEFNLRSSSGGQHVIHLPTGAILQTVSINNKKMPIRNSLDGLSLPVLPGKQKINVTWHEPRGISTIFHTSVVNLGTDSVNNTITLMPGYKRWILLTSGPAMGPAVLFWGVFFIILIVSYGLGRIKGTPLKTYHWILLWIGLSASEPLSALVIVSCIFALKVRNTMDVKTTKEVVFNAFQVLLIVLVLLSVAAFITSIEQGLLGSPHMQISGNGSSAYELNWFSDRIAEVLPQANMISVPVYIYRLIMLAWSIWLAFAVIKWAQWGWIAFSREGYWKPLPKKIKYRKKSRASQGKASVKRKAQVKDELFIDEDDISV